MKKIFAVILSLGFLAANAQQNTLLEPDFWKGKPDLEKVKAEITKGSDPAALNRNSFDPVVYALINSAPNDVIKYLLEQKGNDVSKITHDSRIYLHWAAYKGNVDIMDYLIAKGSKLDAIDSHGATPATFAAGAGQANTKAYETLAKAGVDLKEKNADGASLLLLGISGDKDMSLTNYFVSKGLSINDTDKNGNTAFDYVARTGNLDLMKKLVSQGVTYTDNAMIMASQGTRASSNTLEVYQYLESLKIKPAAVSNATGDNVFHALSRKSGQEAIIKYFLSKAVDANKANNEGNTPFMIASATNKDTAVLSLFLSKTNNINQTNKKGLSALSMAVRSNTPEVVQYLIAKGADVKVADKEGNNLAYYLLQSYYPAEGGKPNPFDAKLKALQTAHVNLAHAQQDGNTLYHLAVVKNDLPLLKQIEPLKADLNAKNKEGVTPLQKAAMVAKDDVILKYLLSLGADKAIATDFKETAYDMAKENEFLTNNKVSVDFLK